jgi:predicted ATPase
MLPRTRSFHGRSNDLARVIDNLTMTSDRRIVCIVGPEGIGKSVLASEAIRLLRMDGWFRDGIAVVRCNRISDPMAILRNVLSRFDSRRRPPVQTTEEGLIAEAHRLLDQKDAAIVLDDVTVSRDTARVVETLHSSGVAILLTSKKSASLAHAVRIRLSQLRQKDALNLLTEGIAGRSANGPAKP